MRRTALWWLAPALVACGGTGGGLGDAAREVAHDGSADVVLETPSEGPREVAPDQATEVPSDGSPGPEAGTDAVGPDVVIPDDDADADEAAEVAGPPADADDGGEVAADPCPRLPAPADRPRKVVVSHPYDANGGPSNAWEVADLSVEGVLTPGGATFHMGRAFLGEVAFTPDGEVGVAAQEDGTLGVFRVRPTGVEVVHAAFQGSFYAAKVVMDAGGEFAWVLDSEWADIGGGVYRVRIGCDGALVDEGRVVTAKLPYGLAFLSDGSGRAVLAAKGVFDGPEGADFHLLSWGDPPEVTGAVAGFPDTDAIIASLAVTPDGRFVLAGDNAEFSGTGNRVAVVEVTQAGLEAREVLSPVEDPLAIIPSPFGGEAAVVSGYGDAVFRITWDPTAATPSFEVDAEPAVTLPLPGGAVALTRGMLTGRVFVSEVKGVRQIAFVPGGGIEDLGVTSFGGGMAKMVGALGVQP